MISLIYETKDFLAINKPAGVLVHEVSGVKRQALKEKTLVDWVLEKYPEVKTVGDEPEIRPGIVHRLDRDTSGVILIARNQKYFEYLKNLFKTYQIKKTYLALVWGKLEPRIGEIKTPIGIKSGTIKRTVWQKNAKDLKEAVTEYKVKKYFPSPFKNLSSGQISAKRLSLKGEGFSLVELMPKTGRTHQIRIHLASINHPVVGDNLYGFKKLKPPFELNRQFLHAYSLEFSTADGHRVRIEAELPEELKKIIDTFDEKR